MPPANRHEPRRAKSSTAEYSLTEFQRQFPDDAACLEHLWRADVNPNSIIFTDDWRYNRRLDHRGMFFALLDNAARTPR